MLQGFSEKRNRQSGAVFYYDSFGENGQMKTVSQRTLVKMMQVLEATHRSVVSPEHEAGMVYSEGEKSKFWSRALYENEFPEWFIKRAEESYAFEWDSILRELRTTAFFYTKDPGKREDTKAAKPEFSDVFQSDLLNDFALRCFRRDHSIVGVLG